MFKIGDRVLLPAQVIEIISNNIVVVNILSKADMTVVIEFSDLLYDRYVPDNEQD